MAKYFDLVIPKGPYSISADDEEAACETSRISSALKTVKLGTAEERNCMERVLAAITSPDARARAEAAWHEGLHSSADSLVAARANALVDHLSRSA